MKFWKLIALISAVSIVSLTIFAVRQPSRASAQQDFSATLSPIAGLIQYRAGGTGNWVNVRDTQLVRPGDQVRTGNDGVARLSTVTGIEVDLYPTTYVQMTNLSMGQESGQTFALSQFVGEVFTNITRTVRQTDQVVIVLPAAGAVVRGTQFWSFVHPDLRGAVLGQDDEVQVISGNGRAFTVSPDNFVYINITLPEPPPAVCTDAFLRDRARATFITVPVSGNTGREAGTRAFLTDFLTSNVNPSVRTYLRELLGLPPASLEGLTPEEDQARLEEILNGIQTLNFATFDLNTLLTTYRSYWSTTYRGVLTNPLAPETCGNLVQDSGETAQNCPTDFSSMASCGNNLCETNRLDLAESVINCPTDCLGGDLALSCAAIIAGRLISGPPGPPPVPLPSTGTPVPPVSTVTPTPSL